MRLCVSKAGIALGPAGAQPVQYTDGTERLWVSERQTDDQSLLLERIDDEEQGESYSQSLRMMQDLVADTSKTPSARLLADLRETGDSFFEYAMNMARSHRDYFASIAPISPQRLAEFSDEAARSLDRQKDIESSNDIAFEQYLANYYAAE